VKKRLVEFAMEPGAMSREEFEAFLRNETARWAKVAKASGVRADD
jgi:tripartite-type tricarboxylate transporter receptor subunit TctC